MPKALHMTSKEPLKALLTGKLPYYWYTTVIYVHSESLANDLKSDLGCIVCWQKKHAPARVFMWILKEDKQLYSRAHQHQNKVGMILCNRDKGRVMLEKEGRQCIMDLPLKHNS